MNKPKEQKPFDLIRGLRRRVAILSIGPSTLRNAGARGVIRVARKYLQRLNLATFRVRSSGAFVKALDRHTLMLMRRFPKGAENNWGAARKAINIYLRDVVYNRLLCKEYHLAHLEPWLELPLDSHAYRGIYNDPSSGDELPAWPKIKGLKPDTSKRFQTAASEIAKSLGVARVHLDLKYWRSES